MLKLSGLTLDAKLTGTITISAFPITGPRFFGATSRQRLLIETSDGTEMVAEDQIIQAETIDSSESSWEKWDKAASRREAR